MHARRLEYILVLILTLLVVPLLLPREVWVISPTLVESVGVRIIVSTISTNIFHLFQGMSIWAVFHHMSCFPALITNMRWTRECHHLYLSLHQSLNFLG